MFKASFSSKEELHMNLRHDYLIKFAADSKLNGDIIKQLSSDLEDNGFNCAVRDEEGWHLLVGLNDMDRMLQQAEK